MAHLVDELDMPDYAFYAWDARGHGRSPGKRGYSPSFAASVRDIDCFIKEATERDGFAVADIAVVAQSVGAVLAATWVHDYAPKIRALVLASPAFSVKLYVPFAKEGIALWQRLKGVFFVNSYVKAKFLTHDAARIASFESDPLITRPIASNILVELYEPCRARRRRRAGHHRADATLDLRRRLGGASRPAARVFRQSGQPGQGAACLPRLLPRHAGRARPQAGGRPGARVYPEAIRRAGSRGRT